jgi:putative ABC transport system permease protein
MKLSKTLKHAMNILLHSKLRSWLTIIGIVIGVASVVSIVSIGEGLQANVQDRLGSLGADLITISPGGGRASSAFRGGFGRGGRSSTTTSTSAKNITDKDLQVLKSIEGIKYIQGIVSGRGESYYLSEKSTVSVDGVDPIAWKEMTTSELQSGRLLGPADFNVVVVGSNIAKSTFKQPLALNRIITIEEKAFKIVGILKEAGGGDDSKIIMPIKAARETLEDVGETKFDSIVIKADNPDFVDSIMENADKKLMISRHVTTRNKDYSISSAKATQERLADITGTMTLFLGAIAAVSLIVGAVGIANTMFTSVLEKTKEIGIMKAIGAKNRDILLIFLFNAGFVGLVGGLIGIGLGSVISAALPNLGLRLMGGGGGLNTVIPPSLLIYSMLLSLLIGMIAGVIPAYRASKLKPVDALRYE